jgi:glycosyltransferase involved in cell wall biosynthesis
LRSVLFTLFCSIAYWGMGRKHSLTVSTEGTFPFCDVCYAHFCHRVYLREHRAAIGGRRLRRMARILNHAWASVMERMAFRSAKIIVVPSEGLARELRRMYPQLVRGKIRVISNPVEFPALADRAVKKSGPETLRISFCALGNFERKGLRLVLEALGRVPDLDVQLTVIGGTPGEIADYAVADDRVQFVGFQKDIWPYLKDSDVFVFPSDYEVFPLVCLQAAAAGLALIVTRLYGVEEFMRDGETGWVVERTAESIAAAILQAATDRPRLRTMGLAARERVAAYSESEFRCRWRSLLGSLIVS